MSRIVGGSDVTDLKTVSSIGVVGMGTVGQATGNAFLQRTRNICVWDKVGDRSLHSFRDTVEQDVVFLCLPTPAGESGRLDVSAIVDVLQRINALTPRRTDNLLVLKSTVPVGTTDRLAREFRLHNLLHSPEFMDAATADHDAAMPRLSVTGYTTITRGNMIARLENLLQEMHGGPTQYTAFRTMRSEESEALKLAMNAFFTIKNSFFNGLHELCARSDLNYKTVSEAMVAEGRVGRVHTEVPGPDGKLGYAGACLPKDSEEYERLLQSHNIQKYQLGAVARLNNKR